MTESNNYLEAEQYIESCISFLLVNKIEEALKAVNKAIECDSNFAEAYNKKGDCLIKLGRIEEALEAYKKSQELNPNIQNNYYDLGRTYLLLGEYDTSLEYFKKANDMKPQADIHAFIGKIYFEKNMYEEAIASFNNLLNTTDANTMTAYYYGQILQKLGDEEGSKVYFDQIIEEYQKQVKRNKNVAEAHYYIGKAQYFKGDYEAAVINLEKAVKLDTDAIYNHYSSEMFYSDAEAFAALAEAQTKAGRSSEAKENILKALSLEPNNKKLLDLKLKLGY